MCLEWGRPPIHLGSNDRLALQDEIEQDCKRRRSYKNSRGY